MQTRHLKSNQKKQNKPVYLYVPQESFTADCRDFFFILLPLSHPTLFVQGVMMQFSFPLPTLYSISPFSPLCLEWPLPRSRRCWPGTSETSWSPRMRSCVTSATWRLWPMSTRAWSGLPLASRHSSPSCPKHRVSKASDCGVLGILWLLLIGLELSDRGTLLVQSSSLNSIIIIKKKRSNNSPHLKAMTWKDSSIF